LALGCGGSSTTPPAVNCGDLGTICTVLGNGVAAYAGEGATPSHVSLYFPIDITFDSQDRLVVIDWNNQRIRRLDLDGHVRTIVGTGFEDSTQVQGTPALETPLHHAYSMAYDGPGNLFIAGYHVPWVLRETPNELVYVFAGVDTPGYGGDGGPALSAAFGIPTGVAVASAGAPVYISDVGDNCIRWVDASGIIHTLCGNGTPGYSGDGGPAQNALLREPYRVRYDDATGAVFICDTSNHVVRRVDASGTITTVAGNGVRGDAGDGGLATEAMLTSPYDARVGPDGALYIADAKAHRIRRVDGSGIITTVAGTGTAGYSGDGGEAMAASFNQPTAIAFDATGNLYICDTGNNVIRKVVLVAP
jgi:NHL repeat-containing protein